MPTTRTEDGAGSEAMLTQSYWTDFYAHNDPTGGSTFCDTLVARIDMPQGVLDIGCGNGRDSCAFGVDGRTVIGLDFSATAVAHATERANALGLASSVTFYTADIASPAALDQPVTELRQRNSDGPVLFYLRFFLHAIPADVQDTLMASIDRLARPDDYFAAEFRTTADETRIKSERPHYRRFQDGPAFGKKLRGDFGFAVIDEIESDGLSPYRDEDPVLYRVIARKAADSGLTG